MTTEDFESTFARGKSLEDFRAFYPDAESCYTDYARRMSERFSVPPSTCECCGSNDRVCRKVATWEVNYQNKKSRRSNLFGLLFILIGHVHLARAVLRFRTKHSVCKSCSSRFSAKRLLTVPLSFVAAIASYAPVVVFVLGAFYLGIGLGAVQKPTLVAWSVVIIAGASIPVLFWIRRQSDVLTIPSFLRPIAKKPIIFRGFTNEAEA